MNLIIIQAREQSERLPNKVLLKVKDKTILEHVYRRCELSKADKVVFAIPRDNEKIKEECIDKRMNYFLGSELDVLDRFYQCAKKWGATNIIRITCDCPVIDYKIINECIDRFMSTDIDFLTNSWIGKERLPDGQDISMITFGYLKYIWSIAEGIDREHVVTYAMNNNKHDYFKKEILTYENDLSNYRLTLDYEEDFELIKILYDNLYNFHNQWYIGMDLNSIIKFLENHPEYVEINSKYVRNESYYRQKENK